MNYYCEEGCGVPTAAKCSDWRKCYKDHYPNTIAMIEEEIEKNKEKEKRLKSK